MVVNEDLTFEVPDGVTAEQAALTEPMAVAYHAVRRGDVGKRDVAVVIGCGPIGLAVIAVLKATGIKYVVASDLSEKRRILAKRVGADVVVDPRVESPYDKAAERRGYVTKARHALALAFDAMHVCAASRCCRGNRCSTPPNGSAPYRRARSFSKCVGSPA